MTRSLSGWQRLSLALLSGVLVAVPFLLPGFYWLTWIAFVPLLLAIEQQRFRATYGLGLASGLMFSMIAGYWITDFLVIAKGYGLAPSLLLGCVFWLFCAHVTAFSALALNGLRRLSLRYFAVHDFVLFPLVVVLAYGLMPILFPFHPADTQTRFLAAIQAIELTGLYGLDAVIALVNVMVFRGMADPRKRLAPPANRSAWAAWGLAAVIVVSWFGYGAMATKAWDERLASWETMRVGIVQPNEAPSLTRPEVWPGYSLAYPPEMAMTERLARAGAELVVWPETRYKGYFDDARVQNAYAARVSGADVALLFQDAEKVARQESGQGSGDINEYNAAVMIGSDGELHGHYRKMKTMPFGEHVPFAETLPILKSATSSVLAGFTTSLQRGTEHVAFQSGAVTVVPLICYETMFPGFVKAAIPRTTRGTVLVGLSNNSWFGDTMQPYQHVNASILRAVENRVPFVHVLNNGPSIVALPNGRILFESRAREAGGYLVDVPFRKAAVVN